MNAHGRSHLLWTTLLAALALGALVVRADATSFTLVDPTFRAIWRPLRLEAAGREVRCNVTLEGSFSARTFAKTAGLRVGSISSAEVASCTGGSMRFLTETLPWSVQYRSFSGSLPRITSEAFKFTSVAMRYTPTGFSECLLRTEANRPIVVITSPSSLGEITTLRLEPNAGIETSGGFLCTFAGEGHFEGTGEVSLQGRETIGLQLLLGRVGTALAGAEAGEREAANNIEKLTIRGEGSKSRAIADISSWYRARVREFALSGGNANEFETPAEANRPCRGESEPGREDGTLLEPGAGSCNILVRFIGANRPRSTRVQVTYVVIGLIWNTTVTQEFEVEAPV